MTLEQKLKEEHPELVSPYEYCVYACPWELGYELKVSSLCRMSRDNITWETCMKCWSREWKGKIYA